MKKIILVLLFICSLKLYGQSEQRIAVALQPIPGSGTAGNLPFAQIISNAKVYVCAYNAQLSCITPVSVYADPNLTPPALAQPLSANILGQYQYYIQSGSQVVENVCSPYNQCHAQSVYFSNAGQSTNTIKVNGTVVTNPDLNDSAMVIFPNGRALNWAFSGSKINAGLTGDGNALHYLDGTGNFSTPPGQITGQASNFVPLGCTATSICGQSHLSDDGTDISTTEPVNFKTNTPINFYDPTGAFFGGDIFTSITANASLVFFNLPGKSGSVSHVLDYWFIFRYNNINDKIYFGGNDTAAYIQSGPTQPMYFAPGCGGVAISCSPIFTLPVITSSGPSLPATLSVPLIIGDARFSVSGCGATPNAGASGTAGTFTITSNSCTVVITMQSTTYGMTAPNGWSCQAHDRTTPTVLIGGETSSTQTTCSIPIPAGAGATDTISFTAAPF